MRFYSYLFLLLLMACSPSSSQDFLLEGESLMKALTEDLKKVHTKEDLLAKQYQLKKRFDQISTLMIESDKQSESIDTSKESISLQSSEELFAEISRIYQIEEGREIVESLQADALARLEAFYRKV